MKHVRTIPKFGFGRALRAGFGIAVLAGGAVAVDATAAAAAIASPPAGGHSMIVFPARDFVSLVSDPLTNVNVSLIRNGVAIGSAAGTTDDTGLLEVNHPGGVCWNGSTPHIIPGDVVMMETAPGVGDATTTADVVVTQGATLVGSDVVVKGTARDAAGNPLPVGAIQQRMIASGSLFDLNGKRDMRAGGGGTDGSFAYDAPGSTSWTAIYKGLDAHDQQLAVSAQSRIMWLGRDPVALSELTIWEFATVGGPTPGCPASSSYAVTSALPSTVNVANVGSGLTLAGSSQDATSVTVQVADTLNHVVSAAASLSAPTGAQTWSAAITGNQLDLLGDGPLTASGIYTVAGSPVGGTTFSVAKDTAAPAPPIASPAAGTYAVAQSVTLSDADPSAVMHFTIDATPPSALSPAAGTSIPVTATQTIRAVAVDAAGNVSGEAAFPYVIGGPAPVLSLTPASLSFPKTAVGATAPTQVVTVQNTGSADLSIGSVGVGGTNPGDFAIVPGTDTCSGTIVVPGATCTFTASFTPTLSAVRSASLSITSNAGGTPWVLSVGGTGFVPAPNATLTPASLTYAAANVGTVSPAQSVTIGNSGTANLNIGGITVAGTNPGDFATTADACSGTTIAPGATCSVGATFTPTAGGARNAVLQIVDNAAGSPQTVALSGSGVVPAPGVTLSPATTTFAGTAVGATTSVLPVTLTNTGNGPLSVTSAALAGTNPGDFAISGDTCSGTTVAARATCTVGVTFTPTVGGARNAALSIVDGAAGSPHTAAVTGTGIAPTPPPAPTPPAPVTVANVRGAGYRMVASDGGIFAFGDAGFLGSMGAKHLNQPIVGMASTPSGNGYWLVARDGGIFAFGDAAFFGSTGGMHLNQPIIGMATTPSGNGYWLLASDGGMFAFGDAAFLGSMGGHHLNRPIVGMAATPTGRGYWLVADDGGIFTFGDAGFLGSMGGKHLNSPIVSMAPTSSGNGYWFVARDGGIFAFGDAAFFGSAGSHPLNQPIVAMTSTPTGRGYWLVARDGGIFAFGDGLFAGSTGGLRLNQPIVGMA